jgi:uncharacterized protein (UPF0332 family)
VQRPIKPAWLLRQANELVAGAGLGQPRNANLRRANSSAYYALFHHIALSTAAYLLPGCLPEDHWHMVRHVPHKGVRKVCDWVAGASNPPASVAYSMLKVRANVALRDVASTFTDMYEVRHDADYNHFAEVNKAATISNIDSVRDAMTKLTNNASTADGQRFLAHVAMQCNTNSLN